LPSTATDTETVALTGREI